MKCCNIYVKMVSILFLITVSECSAFNVNSGFEEESVRFTCRNKRGKQPFTEMKPDKESSPLRLSKEQLGRFSW